jgi:hypothetical protein
MTTFSFYFHPLIQPVFKHTKTEHLKLLYSKCTNTTINMEYLPGYPGCIIT